MKKNILIFGVLLLCIVIPIKTLASSPNYAKSTESKPIGLFFTGYVQHQSSYYDSRGGHALFGWFQYENTADENRYYTEAGKSKDDGKIYSKSKVIRDIWGFGHDKAVFNCGWRWMGDGNYWPAPAGVAEIIEELNKIEKLEGYSILAE